MNVAIVDGDVSYPPTSGKRLRTLNLLLPLAARHRLTYIARGRGDPEEDDQALAFFQQHGIRAVIVTDPLPIKKGLRFYARLGANLLSPLPYSVSSHFSPRMREAVREHARQEVVDLWQVEWTGYLHTVAGQRTPVVLQAHNVDSLIWQRYHENEKRSLKRWYIRQQWRKFERFERRAFQAVTRVVAVSPEDAALAREHFDIEHIDVVDNGVDVEYFRTVQPAPGSRTILYLGSLDWRPNLDALEVLLDAIFPLVRQERIDARLAIVGRNPPAWLRQRVRDLPGVELHADVPDVRPYIAVSAVLAVPLRIGGGSHLKILEALAAGLPVVSTRVGAEGLCLKPGLDYTLANTPQEQAQALLDSLARPEEAQTLMGHGRSTVTEVYDWKVLADRLERVWERAVNQQSPER